MTNTHVGTTGSPRRPPSLETRPKRSTIGKTDGSIIAPIIVTQMPTYQPRPPRSVPGPPSIPRMRSTVTIHATSAPPRSHVAVHTGRGRNRSICGRNIFVPPAAKIKPEQAKLHGDEGLSSGVSGFDMPDGVRCLAQRVGAPDHRRDLSGLGQLGQNDHVLRAELCEEGQ